MTYQTSAGRGAILTAVVDFIAEVEASGADFSVAN